jgi:hypothetical protein
MAGFIPAIHVFTLLPRELKTWMPVTSAGMTARGTAFQSHGRHSRPKDGYVRARRREALRFKVMCGHDGDVSHMLSCSNGSDFPRKRTLTAP